MDTTNQPNEELDQTEAAELAALQAEIDALEAAQDSDTDKVEESTDEPPVEDDDEADGPVETADEPIEQGTEERAEPEVTPAAEVPAENEIPGTPPDDADEAPEPTPEAVVVPPVDEEADPVTEAPVQSIEPAAPEVGAVTEEVTAPTSPEPQPIGLAPVTPPEAGPLGLAPVGSEDNVQPLSAPVAPSEEVLSAPVANWSLDQVRAVIRGELKKHSSISEKDVVERGREFAFKADAGHASWGFKDVFRWLKTDELPVKTKSGFYPNDPLRTAKQACEWTQEELVAFLKGEIRATVQAPVELLLDTIRVEWRIDAPWSDEEVKDYVLFNRRPEQTASGHWVNDCVRARKPAAHWATNELLAFIRDEIPATEAAPETELFKEIRQRFNVSENYTPDRLKHHLSEYKEEPLPMSLEFVKHNLNQYREGMGKGAAVTETIAAGYQDLLYRTIGRVTRLEGREFSDGWTMILDFVHANRTTMFDERRAFRGITVLKLSDRDRKSFEQLLNLAIRTAAPATRYAEAKNTNFTVALRGLTDESARQRILSYYQIGL